MVSLRFWSFCFRFFCWFCFCFRQSFAASAATRMHCAEGDWCGCEPSRLSRTDAPGWRPGIAIGCAASVEPPVVGLETIFRPSQPVVEWPDREQGTVNELASIVVLLIVFIFASRLQLLRTSTAAVASTGLAPFTSWCTWPDAVRYGWCGF